MDDRETLLTACFADPGDDLARLVFADYLEEQGEEDWAAFIRLQLADPKRKWDAWNDFTPDEYRLLAAVPGSPLQIAGQYLRGRRGFFRFGVRDTLELLHSMPRRLGPVFRAGMVETVAFVLNADLRSMTATVVELLAQAGELDFTPGSCDVELLPLLAAEFGPGVPGSRVRRVLLAPEHRERWAELTSGSDKSESRGGEAYCQLTDPPLNTLRREIEKGRFDRIESLNISGRLTPLVAAALARAGVLHRSRNVSFSSLELTTEAAAALDDSGGPNVVYFHHVTWGPGAAAAWLRLRWLRSTKVLDLNFADIGPDGLLTLLDYDFPKLQELSVGHSDPTLDSVRELVTSPTLPRLLTLQVRNPYAPTPDAPGDALDRLRLRLDPGTDRISLMVLYGVEYARNSPTIGPRFTLRNADATHDWPPDAAALDWSAVRAVRLENVVVTPDWFATLTACFPKGLASLELAGCELGLPHIKALGELLPMLSPTRLDLSHNRLGVGAVQRLLCRGRLNSVEELDLSSNPLGARSLEQIAASCPVKLRCLTLRGTASDMTDHDKFVHQARLGPRVRVEW